MQQRRVLPTRRPQLPTVRIAPIHPIAPPPDRTGRSLAGYLTMPRPGDAVKALLMPLTFGLGVLAAGGTDLRTVLRALLVLVVLEFLVYPARYQWNDIRGFVSDQRHPGADRGRLPGPLSMARSRILASGGVAALRLALAGAIALIPGLDLGVEVVVVIVGVFGVAIVYEALRTAATGRHTGGGPPPVTPALAGLWVAVGAGYAVRGMIGLGLAVDLPARPALAVAATVTLWAYGIAFVTSRWAVESLAYARMDGRRVSWAADASHAREHLLALTRWLPSSPEPQAPASLTGWTVLRDRTPLQAPWHVALAITAGAAAVTGLLLNTAGSAASIGAVAVLGAVAALVVAALPGWRVPAVGLGAAMLLWVYAAVFAAHPIVATLPWLAVMAAYLHFSAQCPDTMGHLGRVVRGGLTRALTPFGRLVVGHRTWQVLQAKDPARG